MFGILKRRGSDEKEKCSLLHSSSVAPPSASIVSAHSQNFFKSGSSVYQYSKTTAEREYDPKSGRPKKDIITYEKSEWCPCPSCNIL